jgi:hypothetical protein
MIADSSNSRPLFGVSVAALLPPYFVLLLPRFIGPVGATLKNATSVTTHYYNFSHVSFERLNCPKMVYEWNGASETVLFRMPK